MWGFSNFHASLLSLWLNGNLKNKLTWHKTSRLFLSCFLTFLHNSIYRNCKDPDFSALLKLSVHFLAVQLLVSLLWFSAWLPCTPPLQTSCFLTVGSWLIPGSGTLCPPGNAHGQFGAPLSLSPAHSCDRYSSLRSHRPAPYASPYSHRNNSPSKSGAAALGEGGTELSTCSPCL